MGSLSPKRCSGPRFQPRRRRHSHGRASSFPVRPQLPSSVAPVELVPHQRRRFPTSAAVLVCTVLQTLGGVESNIKTLMPRNVFEEGEVMKSEAWMG
ncbi:hypothetical protein EJB05_00985, partial [Eragrostis curvula]